MINPIPQGPSSGAQWTPIEGDQCLQDTFNVTRMLQDENGRSGLFKHTRPGAPSGYRYQIGTEWVAFALGSVLGLPVAPSYLESYSGIAGSISPWLPDSLNAWLLRQRGDDFPRISNCVLLPLGVVFDIWIANCDRSAANLVLQADPVGSSLSKDGGARVWLIDHGVSLLWPPIKFGLDNEDFSKVEIGNGETQRDRFIRERMLETPPSRRYWETFAQTPQEKRRELYAQIAAISDATLESVVHQVSGAYFDQRQMDLTLQMLKVRRDRVEPICERLL